MQMFDSVQLSPEELFFLAKQEGGTTLDYDYIASMQDISQRRAIIMEECARMLFEKGLLEEEFDGSRSLVSCAADLLNPVYKGDFESVVSYYDGSEQSETIRFHRKEDCWTMSAQRNKRFTFSRINPAEIEGVIKNMVPLSDAERAPSTAEADCMQSVIIVKSIMPGVSAVVNVFYGFDGSIYEESVDHSIQRIDRQEFLNRAGAILGGK